MNKRFVTAAIAFAALALVAISQTAGAEIYKIVDEHGNVVFTDQPPEPGAKPMELPGLSIIESVQMKPPAASAQAAEEGEEEVTDIRELRRGYRDFRITSPTQEQWFEGTGNEVTISWDARYKLQPGMAVVIFLDGKALEPTTASTVTLEQVDRGEHVVTATLVDSRNRKIADASPVTFFVRQYSQYFNRPTPSPAGG